jgi:glycerophosphoryl diester phosphodiesterase
MTRDGRARRPAVIAHRGASDDVAEHTLASYQRAVDDGADALECDVRLTADGHLVCVHDRRVDRTSDGRGPVSTLELADLATLDFASWHAAGSDADAPDLVSLDPAGGSGDASGHRSVLTLDRLLRFVADCDRPVPLAIETKHPTRYAGLVERRLVELLERHGLTAYGDPDEPGRVRVMSFSLLSLRRMRALAPAVETVLLMDRVPLRHRDGTLPRTTRIAGPSIDVVRAHPGYVARAQERGHDVHVWTVDAESDVELCLDLGVDAIVTNRPRRVREQVEARH